MFRARSRPLENGDIITIDVTVFIDDYHGDTSDTFVVGNVVRSDAHLPCVDVSHLLSSSKDPQGRALISATQDALRVGIMACGPGRPFSGIGAIISELVKMRGYSVSSQLTGHGIGEAFHCPPWILHHGMSSFLK